MTKQTNCGQSYRNLACGKRGKKINVCQRYNKVEYNFDPNFDYGY